MLLKVIAVKNIKFATTGNNCHDFLMLYLNTSDVTLKLLQFLC